MDDDRIRLEDALLSFFSDDLKERKKQRSEDWTQGAAIGFKAGWEAKGFSITPPEGQPLASTNQQ